MSDLNELNGSQEQVVGVPDVEQETNVDATDEVVEGVKEEATEPQTEKSNQSREDDSKFANIRKEKEFAETKALQLEQDLEISRKFGKEWGIHSLQDIIDEYGDSGINTVEDFENAIREQEAQEMIEESGVDPETINELVKNHPLVKEAEALKQQEAEKAKYAKFFSVFEELNGKPYDASTDIIPKEVWDNVEQGKSLDDAYAIFKAKELREQLEAISTNKKNDKSATPSVDGSAETNSDYISEDEFEENRHDKEWVNKHYTQISESRKKWKT